MENNNCKGENESNKLSHDEREGFVSEWDHIFYIWKAYGGNNKRNR